MKMPEPSPRQSCPGRPQSCPGRPGAVLLALVLPFLLIAPPAGSAEESAPAGEAAPAEQGAAAGKKKKKAAGDAEPKGLTIDWNGVPLTKVKIINRMGRLKKVNNWENLDKLSQKAIAAGNEHGDRQLVTLGTWYQVYVLLNRDPPEQEGAFKKFQEAVGLGYRNVVEMAESPELETLRQKPEVAEVIARLEKDLKERLRAEFRAEVDAAFASAGQGAGTSRLSDLRTVQGEPLWKDGRAMAIAVTRVHHEGFEKTLPALAKIREQAPVGLLFYQFDAADKGRKDQTGAYLHKLGLKELPCAIIDREAFKELTAEILARRAAAKLAGSPAGTEDDRFQEYLPYLLFFDGKGNLLYGACGVLADEQLAYVLEKFRAHAGTRAGAQEAKAAQESEEKGEKKGEKAAEETAEGPGEKARKPEEEPKEDAEPAAGEEGK
jgi:hypothetical protein